MSTVYKSLSGKTVIDHESATVTISNPATRSSASTDWDHSGDLVIPAEWIDRVEVDGSVAKVWLVNHGSVPLPNSQPGCLWSLPLLTKKKAAIMAADIERCRLAFSGSQRRPFRVPQPLGKTRDRVLQAQSKLGGVQAFGGVVFDGRNVYAGGRSISAAGASAVIDAGAASQSAVSAGRVIGGALLGGTAGAIIGASAKKSTGELFVTVTGGDGSAVVGFGPSTQMNEATALVNSINAAG